MFIPHCFNVALLPGLVGGAMCPSLKILERPKRRKLCGADVIHVELLQYMPLPLYQRGSLGVVVEVRYRRAYSISLSRSFRMKIIQRSGKSANRYGLARLATF